MVPSAQENMSFSVDAASAPMLRELTSGCGALIAGRRLFDQTDGWGDNHPAGAPVVVVTHRPPPEDAPERFPRTTFTGSVEEAIATAKQIAGDKFVTIASANRKWISALSLVKATSPAMCAATAASESAARSTARRRAIPATWPGFHSSRQRSR